MSPFFKNFDTKLVAALIAVKSGLLFWLIGVGTVIINKLHFINSFFLVVKSSFFFYKNLFF